MVRLVQYPAYREFNQWRIDANDYGQALAIGVRIACSHITRARDADPKQTLPEAFPDIAGVQRLRVKLSTASEIMLESERFLAYMAIPFYVAVYDELLLQTLRLLIDEHVVPYRDTSKVGLTDLRSTFRDEVGVQMPEPYTALFDWLQYLRNRIIYRGARVSSSLVSDWKHLDATAKAIWIRAAKRSPVLDPGKRADLRDGEVRATLAVTYRLAVSMNEELARLVQPNVWLRVAARDFVETYPRITELSRDRLVPKLLAHARIYYRPLDLPERDLLEAFDRLHTARESARPQRPRRPLR